MLIARTYMRTDSFLDLINYYYIVDDDEIGLSPFIKLFDLLSREDFLVYLVEFINAYQEHLQDDCPDANPDESEDWLEQMTDEYDHEIYCYARDNYLNFVFTTSDLVDFTLVFMELASEYGIAEIYDCKVESIEVNDNGRLTIEFEEDRLFNKY